MNVAVSFVSHRTVKMSALVANKMTNLIPIPDEIIFITPNVDSLKAVHATDLTTTIPHRYISDNSLSDICKMQMNSNSLGWLPRQWVQLHLDIIIPYATHIITCDSDLVVNRPLELFSGDKINFFVESERYEPYFITIKKLLPKLTTFMPYGDSFNSEIMVFVPMQLKALRDALNIDFCSWMSMCNNENWEIPGFSEYETIGTWMLNKVPNTINLVKSDTYNNNNKYLGKHKLSDLLKIKEVLPLRIVRDVDIEWDV